MHPEGVLWILREYYESLGALSCPPLSSAPLLCPLFLLSAVVNLCNAHEVQVDAVIRSI